MNKKMLIVGLAALAIASMAHADLKWFNSAAITDNGGTDLASSQSDPTVGCFAQLIKASGSSASAYSFTGSGVSGGDAVVATMYCGQDYFLATDGYFPLQATAAVSGSAGNGFYYVRAFDAAQTLSDWNQGNAAPIPTAASYYFQSDVHEYAHNPTVPDDWDFASAGGATTLVAQVPEPTTLAFLGLGAVAFFARKRMRS